MGINIAYQHLMNQHYWLSEQAPGERTGRQEQVLDSFRNALGILYREQSGSLEILP